MADEKPKLNQFAQKKMGKMGALEEESKQLNHEIDKLEEAVKKSHSLMSENVRLRVQKSSLREKVLEMRMNVLKSCCEYQNLSIEFEKLKIKEMNKLINDLEIERSFWQMTAVFLAVTSTVAIVFHKYAK